MDDSKEIGRVGQRRYGGTFYEEFLPELRGKRRIAVYHEMSDNDDIVGAILFAVEMLVRQCSWNVEPGGATAKDREAAEFKEGKDAGCQGRPRKAGRVFKKCGCDKKAGGNPVQVLERPTDSHYI